MAAMRWLHKWLGLIVGIQMTIWLLSGLMMSAFNMQTVSGADRVRGDNDLLPASAATLDAETAARSGPDARIVRLRTILGQSVYEIVGENGLSLVSAETGAPFDITSERAAEVAREDFSGSAPVTRVILREAPFLELRTHDGPVWRVDFDDGRETTLYVDGETGRILSRRNNVWRVFDVFWMLHTMDYAGRDNFNNPLIIIAGISALWLALTGFITLFSSFRLQDFDLISAMRRWRGRRIQCTLEAPDASPASQALAPGLSYFDALAARDIQLPSNCGGAGTCGLCVVRVEPDRPPTGTERRLLPDSELRNGARLACQHRTRNDDRLELPEGILGAKPLTGQVTETRFIAPFIKEITVKLNDRPARSPVSGQYVQVEIPEGAMESASFDIPEGWRARWFEHGLPARIEAPASQRRSYSMATAPHEDPKLLVLNVRAVPPASDKHSWGVGSSYIFSRKPGDEIVLHGPFGRFRPTERASELVLIGGGSGMAPLRSLIRHEYSQYGAGRPVTFFYGARTGADILYSEEFETLAKHRPEFRWVVALSDPGDDESWSGRKGLIHETAKRDLKVWDKDLLKAEFLLCGPPALVEASTKMLLGLNVPSEHIHVEDFGV